MPAYVRRGRALIMDRSDSEPSVHAWPAEKPPKYGREVNLVTPWVLSVSALPG